MLEPLKYNNDEIREETGSLDRYMSEVFLVCNRVNDLFFTLPTLSFQVAVLTFTLFPIRLLCLILLVLLASLIAALTTACMKKEEEPEPLRGYRRYYFYYRFRSLTIIIMGWNKVLLLSLLLLKQCPSHPQRPRGS